MGLRVVQFVSGVGGERLQFRILLVRRQLKISSARMGSRRTPVLLLLIKLPKPPTLYLKFCRRQKKRLVVRIGILRIDKLLLSNAA